MHELIVEINDQVMGTHPMTLVSAAWLRAHAEAGYPPPAPPPVGLPRGPPGGAAKAAASARVKSALAAQVTSCGGRPSATASLRNRVAHACAPVRTCAHPCIL